MTQCRIIRLLQPITKLYLFTIELKLRNDFRCFRSKICFSTFSTVPLNSSMPDLTRKQQELKRQFEENQSWRRTYSKNWRRKCDKKWGRHSANDILWITQVNACENIIGWDNNINSVKIFQSSSLVDIIALFLSSHCSNSLNCFFVNAHSNGNSLKMDNLQFAHHRHGTGPLFRGLLFRVF